MTTIRTVAARAVTVVAVAALAACTPKAPPLVGTIAPASIPATRLPPVHRQLVFLWSYADRDFRAKGDGAARVAPPDSVRIDLFVGGGYGSGSAVLVDDRLETRGDERMNSYLPPVPFLWAALGRFTVPPAADTTARVDGDTLRVEIGRGPAWRAIFAGDELRRLELIDGGRIQQWVSRDSAGHVHYEHERARRTLDLTVTRVDTVPAFDAAIWR
ncbi:MAG TPA: hypothetical protein VFR95_01320 [Gemmatimonadaceae bacterium]|nr:hypothetical protein [Gemmatimonadaceae bacterium]